MMPSSGSGLNSPEINLEKNLWKYDDEYSESRDGNYSRGIPNFQEIQNINKKLEDLKENFQVQRELIILNKNYQNNFYNISNRFENWAAERRKLIRKLKAYAIKIENTKNWCNKGKLTFSSICILGSLSSIILEQLNSNWASKIAFATTAIGTLSLACSLIDLYITQSCTEDVIRSFNADKSGFEALERDIKSNKVNDEVYKLFPYRVNSQILRNILTPQIEKDDKMLKYKNIFHDLSFDSQDEKISFAILLSNIIKEPELMKNKEFVSKVKTFSKSKIAGKWWNRLKYKNSSHRSEKMKLYNDIKSYLKMETMPLSTLSLVTLPLTTNRVYLPEVGNIILNSIVLFDAFCEIVIKIMPKESSTFKQLEGVLRKEYYDLKKAYDLLNPYD